MRRIRRYRRALRRARGVKRYGTFRAPGETITYHRIPRRKHA